jgi:GNAT superfamily N-acetyltransferase
MTAVGNSFALRVRAPGDAELAAMAEHIECRAWIDMIEAAPPWLRHTTRVEIEHVAGAVVLSSRALHTPLFNRVIGLGEQVPAQPEHVTRLMDRYWDLGVQNYFIHAGPYARPARLGRLLQEHGLIQYRRSWVKMMRPARVTSLAGRAERASATFGQRVSPARPAERAQTDLVVRGARAADVTAIASIVGPAFDLPQNGAELFAQLTGRRQWKLFVAASADEIVATGGLFIEGEMAYCAFAATRPEFRGRGAQRALMQTRIDTAVDAGCHWIATETGFPLTADEPNPSYHNMLWAGFRAVAIRDNYGLPQAQWPRSSE